MVNNVSNDFIEWLRNEIEGRNLSIREFARAIGVSHPTISDILNGKKPSYETCKAIACYLRLPPEEIFERAGLLPPKPQKGPITRLIERKITELPPEQQQQVIKFIEFLADQQELEENQEKFTAAKPVEQSE